MRLNIGGGTVRYSNCINLELTKERDNHVDVLGDVRKTLPFDDNKFEEILMIHVIEHIERKFHKHVFDEIWRILQPESRLILAFPDAIEVMKGFIENKGGKRWEVYNQILYGRQDGEGDYHVTAMERQNITTKLFHAGFVNVKYKLNGVNAILSCRKGEQLNEYLQ